MVWTCGKSKVNHGKHNLAGYILTRRYHTSSDWYQSLYETIYYHKVYYVGQMLCFCHIYSDNYMPEYRHSGRPF